MLTESVIKAIEEDVPGISQYIESRFLRDEGILMPVQN